MRSAPAPGQAFIMSEFKEVASIVDSEKERLWRSSPGLGLQALWKEAAGADIAAHASVRWFRDGVMTVSCASGGWACELRLAAGDLIARINALGAPEKVREIRFVHQAQASWKSSK